MLKDILSIKDFDRNLLESFIADVKNFEGPKVKFPTAHPGCGFTEANKPKILATLFFEPSTRTRLSFESAMIRLGGQCIGFSDPQNSSVQKGESIRDTIKTIEGYADCIVIRHHVEGTARLAASLTSLPVINAGDGSNSHISQHLLDLYTIQQKLDRLDNLKIGYIGDLKYGRTVRGLAYALSLLPNNRHYFVAPDPGLQIDEIGFLTPGSYEEHNDLSPELLSELDVLYVTRLQKERYPDPQEYNRIIRRYRITKETLLPTKKGFIVMHPLPRNTEIAEEVDELPSAAYFAQAHNGAIVRKCLLYNLITNQGLSY